MEVVHGDFLEIAEKPHTKSRKEEVGGTRRSTSYWYEREWDKLDLNFGKDPPDKSSNLQKKI